MLNVRNVTGSVLNEIGNIADMVLFGDEDYLFQFAGARFKTEHNTDPKDLTRFAYYKGIMAIVQDIMRK